jgi:AbrB family looped-hinge helix DNA binding protein
LFRKEDSHVIVWELTALLANQYYSLLKYHTVLDKYGNFRLSYTVTEKGTVTIPVRIRKKYNLKRGSKVKFLETEHGALLIPSPSFEELRGVIKKDLAYEMIKELQEERMREAKQDES